LDGRRGRLLGNAIVPSISEWIGKRILDIEKNGF
jgi:DNA (cytosine-5)-methyltransferase 1